MHWSFHRLALAVLLAGSANFAPLLNAGAAAPSMAGTVAAVAAVRSIGAVVALTAPVPTPATPLKNTPPPAAPTGTHGMLAALLAGTGNYGQPLISGCAWATWVTNCQNLTAYGNGSSFDNVGCGAPFGCEFGPEFQCTQLALRYAFYAWGEPAQWGGAAYQMWGAGPNLPVPLEQFANGAGAPPMQGDLMIFAPGWLGRYWDGSGHVAVVRDVGPGYVDMVEQNATSSGTDRFALNGSLVTANGYTPIIGWLRETEQAPVELTAFSVAGTPQSVSDQPGNIDVMWRGTDTRLHDIAYRSEAWQPQSPAAISPADVASDPAVVSPAPGQVDAFWEDSLGNLWQVQSQSGFFGSESWSLPQELQVGTLAIGSAPTAVSQAPGEMAVIWKAVDGQLWVNRFNGAWSAATPLNSGAIQGNPDAVATPNGTIGVVWRDAAGNLWSDLGAAYGWLGAHEIGTGGLASDPTVVTSGPATVDAVWRTHAGSVWAAVVTANGGPAQVQVDSAVSMGQPAAAGTAASAVTVVMQRANGSLAAAIYAPSSGWVGPEQLNRITASSYVSAVSWYSNAVATFWQGSGGSLWWSAACAGCAAHPPPVFNP
jgi:CHAP domain